MLSPDVPEFIPREIQKQETSGMTECEWQPKENDASLQLMKHNADEAQPYSLNVDRGGNLHSSEYRETSKFQEPGSYRTTDETRNSSRRSDQNWRSAPSLDWNSKYSTAEKGSSIKGHRNRKGSSKYESSTENRLNWRKTEYQSPSTYNSQRFGKDDNILDRKAITLTSQDHSFQNDSITRRPRNEDEYSIDDFDVRCITQNETQAKMSMKPSNIDHHRNVDVPSNSSQSENSQESFSTKFKVKSIPHELGKTKGSKVKNVEKCNVKHNLGNVSYKKILSRKSDNEIVGVKAEQRNVKNVPSPLNDQWPSLFPSNSKNPVKELDDNVWGVKDSSIEINLRARGPSTQLPFKENKIFDVIDDGEENYKYTKDGNKQRVSSAIENSDHNIKSRSHNKSEKDRRNRNTSFRSESSTKSERKPIENREETLKVLSKQNPQSKETLSESTESLVNKMEEQSEWQTQKKKKSKSRGKQEEVSVRSLEGKGRLKKQDKGSGENKSLNGTKFSGQVKGELGNRKGEPANRKGNDYEDLNKKHKSQSTKFSRESKFTGAKQFQEKISSVKQGKIDGRNDRDEQRSTFDKGNDVMNGKKSVKLSLESTTGATSKQTLKNIQTNSCTGNTQNPECFDEKKGPSIEDKECQVAKAMRKAKKKEEKMRKRESRLKAAKNAMKSDTKLTMVDKDLLEMLYGSINQHSKLSMVTTRSKPSQKQTAPSQPQEERFQLATSDYPSLMKESSKHSSVGNQCSYKEVSSSARERFTRGDESIDNQSGAIPKRRKVPPTLRTEDIVGDFDSQDNQNDFGNVSDTEENSLDVFSYSKALLASKSKKKVQPIMTAPKKTIVTKVAVVPKKKVKGKSEITYDLFDAVTKKKLTVGVKKQNRKDVQVNVDPILIAKKKRIQRRCNRLLEALNPDDKSTSKKKGNHTQEDRKSFKSPKAIKQRPEVNAKRGKKRETEKVKKPSRLRRAILREKQQELEKFCALFKEVKNLQESSALEGTEALNPNGTLAAVKKTTEAQEQPITGTNEFSKEIQKDHLVDLSRLSTDSVENDNDGSDEKQHKDIGVDENSDLYAHTTKITESNNVDVGSHSNTSEINDVVGIGSHPNIADINILGKVNSPDIDGCDKNGILTEKELSKSSERTSKIQWKVEDLGNFETRDIVSQANRTLGPISQDLSLQCQNLAMELGVISNTAHNSLFREYCNHMVTTDINQTTRELICSIVRFQERQFKNDPVKARMRQRYVCGLKSITKKMAKMSCIIVAPNIRRSRGPGALDEVVYKMLNEAQKQGVPVIFALTSKLIGKLCIKQVPISCIGIMNYHGAQDAFHKLLVLLPEAQQKYQALIDSGKRSVPVGDEPPDEEVESENKKNENILDTCTMSEKVLSKDTISCLDSRKEGQSENVEELQLNERDILTVCGDELQNEEPDKINVQLLKKKETKFKIGEMHQVDERKESTMDDKKYKSDNKEVNKKDESQLDTRDAVIASTVSILCEK